MRSSTVSTWPNIIVALEFKPEPVGDPHDLEPLVGVALERRDSVADAIDQDFAAAAGNRAEAGLLESADHFLQRHPEDLGEVVELRRLNPWMLIVRILLPDVGEQVEIPVDRRASDDGRPA